MAVVVVVTSCLVGFRVKMLHGHLPHFSAQDNPASFANSSLTRTLTYMYLYYFNAKLLVAPITLCYDWQMGSIPMVETVSDVRNIGTVAFFCYFLALCWIALTSASKVSCGNNNVHTQYTMIMINNTLYNFPSTEKQALDFLFHLPSGGSISTSIKPLLSSWVCYCREDIVHSKVSGRVPRNVNNKCYSNSYFSLLLMYFSSVC